MNKRCAFVCMLLAGVLLLGGCAPAAVPDAPLSRFYFSENSNALRPVHAYEYRLEDGAHTVLFDLSREDEPYAARVDQRWADTLTGLIRQYEMMGWNGFDKDAALLIDGTQFSVSFAFTDGTSVAARGYGRFPDNYAQAAEAVEAHFMQLLPAEKRGW